jgi:hypothetical protein
MIVLSHIALVNSSTRQLLSCDKWEHPPTLQCNTATIRQWLDLIEVVSRVCTTRITCAHEKSIFSMELSTGNCFWPLAQFPRKLPLMVLRPNEFHFSQPRLIQIDQRAQQRFQNRNQRNSARFESVVSFTLAQQRDEPCNLTAVSNSGTP